MKVFLLTVGLVIGSIFQTFPAFAQVPAHAVQSQGELRKLDTLNIAANDGQQVTFYGVEAVVLDPGTSRFVANGVSWKLDAADGTRTTGTNGQLGFDSRYPYANLVFEIPGAAKWSETSAPTLDNGYWYLRFTRVP